MIDKRVDMPKPDCPYSKHSNNESVFVNAVYATHKLLTSEGWRKVPSEAETEVWLTNTNTFKHWPVKSLAQGLRGWLLGGENEGSK
ncbi:hypothetical protein LCGC14_1949340 [marine sediment metagenome]|uniref:Uncharacterized protein n=1 Tax=marine sediment metagenome TaxID=412755 RepID=A0A0F9HW98_9ZZZZ